LVVFQCMTYKSSFHHIRKIFALAAATLILPALAHADTDNGKGNDGENNGNQNGKDKGDATVTSTPEPNTAIVLIPFLGAVLVVGSIHLWRRQKNASV
jgi:1,4-dihydroxy-2-naphthoate octaprenyltransferase